MILELRGLLWHIKPLWSGADTWLTNTKLNTYRFIFDGEEGLGWSMNLSPRDQEQRTTGIVSDQDDLVL